MTLQTHKDLKVWQESRKLVTEVYALTSKFPKEEIYSITAQIKRVTELDTQLIIAKDLNFINEKEFKEISEKLDNIGKMLSGLIKYRQSKL